MYPSGRCSGGWRCARPSSDEITGYVGDRVEAGDELVLRGGVGRALRRRWLRRDRHRVRQRGAGPGRPGRVRPVGRPDRPVALVADRRRPVRLELARRASWPSRTGRSTSPHADYRDDFSSITRGIGHYERYIPTTAGPVRLTYFDNLVWDGADAARGREAVRRRATSGPTRSTAPSSTRVGAARGDQRPGRWSAATRSGSPPRSRAATTRPRSPCSPTRPGAPRPSGSIEPSGGADDSGARLAEALGLRFHSIESCERAAGRRAVPRRGARATAATRSSRWPRST